MKNINLFLIAFSLLVFNSCIKENLQEPTPSFEEKDIDGNEYFVNGTLGGEPFELKHYDSKEFNLANNTTWNGPEQSNFGSDFIKTRNSIREITLMRMAITESSENSLLEVLSQGEINWYKRDNDVIFQNGQIIWEPSIGEVYFPIMQINGKNYADAMDFDYNKFEITSYELLDTSIDTGISGSSRDGKMYKVEGNFQIKLIDPDGEEVNLIAESFSALFTDK